MPESFSGIKSVLSNAEKGCLLIMCLMFSFQDSKTTKIILIFPCFLHRQIPSIWGAGPYLP